MDTNQMIEKLIETGGAIITSDSCHPAEIAIARAQGRFALHGDFGLVLKPSRWVKNAQKEHVLQLESERKDCEFRKLLLENGVSGAIHYEWNNGDPLYMGDPISGRASAEESKAIAGMGARKQVTMRELRKHYV